MNTNRALLLRRPLIVVDTETTGARPHIDRIVEIALVTLHPDGRRETWVQRVNPETRIPVEATAVHGIRNEDVELCPTFRKIAGELVQRIGEADLCGFNIHGFDLRIMQAEFARCGEIFSMDNRQIVDAQVIFHKHEPRDLSAAVRFYLDRDHAGAHGAAPDAEATLDVLIAQLARYGDLEPNVAALAAASRRKDDRYADPDRKLEWRDGEACFTFGKHAGRTLRDVVSSDPDYIDWVMKKDFPEPLREILRNALEGRFPTPNIESSD